MAFSCHFCESTAVTEGESDAEPIERGSRDTVNILPAASGISFIYLFVSCPFLLLTWYGVVKPTIDVKRVFICVSILFYSIKSAFLLMLQPKEWRPVWKPRERAVGLLPSNCQKKTKSQFLASCVHPIPESRSDVQRWLVLQPLRYIIPFDSVIYPSYVVWYDQQMLDKLCLECQYRPLLISLFKIGWSFVALLLPSCFWMAY
jgi:hypothetical protein